MSGVISKKMLKSALVDLAKSDRDFLVDLFSEVMSLSPTKSLKPKNTPKEAPNFTPKYAAPYLQEAQQYDERYAVSKEVILELQDLFKDEPAAEDIIKSLNKGG